ncbi:TfoX/Sxy family DNA transformation protein [Conservatibacter flavescens]|uniref:DNA transformation protein n=1 Tax=Conservatibacter flavescens TaxID=28161 RepID=A0A2M8S1K1_9PAST|nr:TfoX/Sxy family DNA transformation protein [Conservatibacter flavescens]PJG85032.1 DNA transformation protein [Conservatibacter flavescens]
MQMNKTNQDTEVIRKHLTTLIGKVTAKKLFSGYGLFYSESLMFGIYHHKTDQFYIRAESDSLVRYIKSLGAEQWSKGDPPIIVPNYYLLPNSIKQNHHVYQRILMASIDELRDKRNIEELSRRNRLRDMLNLSLKYERLLAKVDIPDVNTLRSVGAAGAYVRLKKQDFPVTEKLFWLLVGALKNKPVELLTEQEKKSALNALNHALIAAGLPPIEPQE